MKQSYSTSVFRGVDRLSKVVWTRLGLWMYRSVAGKAQGRVGDRKMLRLMMVTVGLAVGLLMPALMVMGMIRDPGLGVEHHLRKQQSVGARTVQAMSMNQEIAAHEIVVEGPVPQAVDPQKQGPHAVEGVVIADHTSMDAAAELAAVSAAASAQEEALAAQTAATLKGDVRHREAPGPCKVGVYGGQVNHNYGKWAVCTNWLDEKSVVYSFGIGPDSSFDVDVVNRHGSLVFCFDPTITSEQFQETVDSAKPSENWGKDDRIHFEALGLGAEDKMVTFYTKGNKGSAVSMKGLPGYGKAAVEGQVLTVPSIMAKYGHDYVDVLKVDVEGAEFDVFEQSAVTWIDTMRPQQILLEFHSRLFPQGYELQDNVLNNLASRGYKVEWKSGNKWEYLLSNEKL